MGAAGSKKFLDREPDWTLYIEAEWRSVRSRELDKLGGLCRDTVASGQSVTAKLELLRKSLEVSGKHLSDMLYAQSPTEISADAFKRGVKELSESRAMQAGHNATAHGDMLMGSVPIIHHTKYDWGLSEGDERKRLVEARRRMLQYGQAQSEMHSRPAAAGSDQTAATSSSAIRRRRFDPKQSLEVAEAAELSLDPAVAVAAWRQRVHGARRRTWLKLLVIIRLTRDGRRAQRVGTTRLRRVESFSWYVASVLGGESGKFVLEQRKFAQARTDMEVYQMLLEVPEVPLASGSSAITPEASATLASRSSRLMGDASGHVSDGSGKGEAAAVRNDSNISIGRGTPSMSLEASTSSTGPDARQGSSAEVQLQPSTTANTIGYSSGPLRPSSPLQSSRGTLESISFRRVSSPGLALFSAAVETADGGRSFPLLPTASFRAKRMSTSGLPDAAGAAPARNLFGRALVHMDSRAPPAHLAAVEDGPRREPSFSGFTDLTLPPADTGASSSLPGINDRPTSAQKPLPPYLQPLSPRPPAQAPSEAMRPLSRATLGRMNRRASVGPLPGQSVVQSSPQALVGTQKARRASLLLSGEARPRQRRSSTSAVPAMDLELLSAQPSSTPSTFAPSVPAGASAAAAAVLGSLEGMEEEQRQSSLNSACASCSTQIEQSERLMKMLINRSNAGWAEAQDLRRPAARDGCASATWASSVQAAEYKKTVADVMFRGQLAIQLFTSEDSVVLPSGAVVDLWDADPWQLLEECRPARMPHMERIEGITLGTRAMLQLVLAIRTAGGEHALKQLTLILHVSEQHAGHMMADFIEREFYGLAQRNVIFVVGPHWAGYRFDSDIACFKRDPLSQGAPIGTGHGLMQCAWPGEAFTVSGKDRCDLLRSPVLEELARRGVSWMMSHRLMDLSLLTMDGAFDMPLLAYTLFLRDRHGVNMTVQAMETDSYVASRAHDSVIFARYVAPNAGGSADAAPRGGDLMVELRQTEVVSPVMSGVMDKIKAANGNKLLVGLKKYVFHVPCLLPCLSSGLGLFRPKMSLSGELVHVCLDIQDVMTAPQAQAAAVLAPVTRVKHILCTAADAVHLVPILQRQDHDGAFRTLLSQHTSSSQQAVVVAASLGPGGALDPQSLPGHHIAVLLDTRTAAGVSERAVAAATALARPGRDVLHLVTVVATQAHQAAGEQLVQQHFLAALKSTVHTTTAVLVKYPMSLLDTLDFYIKRSGVQMVVMGSCNITNIGKGKSQACLYDSITVACIKRFSLPIVVVTANCTLATPNYAKKETLRVAVLAERHAKPVADCICRALDPARGDKFALIQVLETSLLTREQRSGARCMVDALADVAARSRVSVFTRVQAVGKLHDVLPQFQQDNKINLMAIQLPVGRKGVTTALLRTIAASRCAIMVYGGLMISKQH